MNKFSSQCRQVLWTAICGLVLCTSQAVSAQTATHHHAEAASASLPKEVQPLVTLGRYFDVALDENDLQRVWQTQSGKQDSWARLVKTARVAKLPFVARRLVWREVQRHGGVMLLRLRAPEEAVVVQAIGAHQALLWQDERDTLVDNTVLEQRYSGEALLRSGDDAAHWQIDNPVRILKVDTIGGNSEVVETLTLHNRGDKPLSVKVTSTSCGCTGASVAPETIAPGTSGTLTAKMHTTANRLVTVNLQSDDAARPHAVVALQTLKTSATSHTIRGVALVFLLSYRAFSADSAPGKGGAVSNSPIIRRQK